MEQILLNCELHHSQIVESFSYFIDRPITLKKLSSSFPFEGEFHFRIRVDGNELGLEPIDFWLDISANDQFYKNSQYDIQVILLNFDSEIQSFPEFISPDSRPNRYQIENEISSENPQIKKTSQFLAKLKSGVNQAKSASVKATTGLKDTAQKAKSIWNSVANAASHLHSKFGQGSILSETAEDALFQLSEELSTQFNESNPKHMTLLEELWGCLFPGLMFEQESPKWREAGWQKNSPISDLKSSGILALRGMVFLCRRHPLLTQQMLSNNKANIKTNYPFAIVGVNLCLMLAEVLFLRDQKYFSVQAGYWEVFEEPLAFMRIYSACFFHMDHMWTTRKAVRTDFGALIGEIKELVNRILSKSPRSIIDFQVISAEVGLVGADIEENDK